MKKYELSAILAGLALIGILFWVESYFLFIFMPLLLTIGIFYVLATRALHEYTVYTLILGGTLSAFFVIAEIYFNVTQEKDLNASTYVRVDNPSLAEYGSNWYADPLLGYGPKPMKSTVGAKKVLLSAKDTVLFDAIYSTDDAGRRITVDNSATAENAVVLLGCSFTFGDGLSDQETFAWQLGKMLGEKYQVFNYGFSGYGSHQILALVQSDRLDFLKKTYKNVYAYYLTFPGIELRSVGHSLWDKVGPKYVLDDKNTAVRAGTFADDSFWVQRLSSTTRRFLKMSFLFTKIDLAIQGANITYSEPEKQIQLHAATIFAAEKEFTKKFQGSTFTPVLYKDFDALKALFKEADIRFLELHDAFSPQGPDADMYVIPHDGHPSAAAAKIIAQEYYNDIQRLTK